MSMAKANLMYGRNFIFAKKIDVLFILHSFTHSVSPIPNLLILLII